MTIDASELGYRELNERVRTSSGDCEIINCLGQRFIGDGLSGRSVTVCGVPGNALGAYLNGAKIEVFGNAQDAVGDTMNDGEIIIHGSVGDAAGYAMRGGRIYIRGNAGYRTGIHMKAYREKLPIIIIGGSAGSFLGEYQAGGVIIVLGMGCGEKQIVSNFPGAGMHGGKMFLRSDCKDMIFPAQVRSAPATQADRAELGEYLKDYSSCFGVNTEDILNSPFTVVTPDSNNPYRQMYVAN